MFPSVDISDTFIHNSNPDPNPNPSYFQEHHDVPPLLFSNFPSPFYDEQSDCFSSKQQHHIFNNNEISSSRKQASISLVADPPQRKMRKDRHSKIFTAQGVRARRMRLPLEIARKFFDLQDMLGYDKPSKTIEWLMSKSKGAIREISKYIPSSSRSGKRCDSSEGHGKKKRELREKARTRARERTQEKMRMRMRNIGKMTKLGCSASTKLDSPLDSSSSHQSLNKQFSYVGFKADCSISTFDHHENILGGFDYNNRNSFTEVFENWDMENP